MKCKGNRKSKKQKLSLKYNIQKRCREHKRRVKKEAKKLGLKKRVRKDPGIPNTLPWKAELLADIEQKKARREEDLAKKRAEAKAKAKQLRDETMKQAQEMHREKESERRAKRAEQVLLSQLDALRKMLLKADVLLHVLDARDPLGCRCPELEKWVKENGKQLIFVLGKSDLVTPQQAAQWVQVLGQVGPTVSVAVEAGGDGLAQLIQMLGHGPEKSKAPASSVGILGYEGTGKRALSKAIRREAPGASQWLLESLGRLRPAEDPEGEAAVISTLHLALRGMLAKGGGSGQSGSSSLPPAEPLDAVKHLLERSSAQALMRRYRLAAFEGAEGLLEAWVKVNNVKTKKGKAPGVEAAAQRFLQELSSSPCCSCTPPEQALEGAGSLWAAHSEGKPRLEAVMTAQIQQLRARDASASPAAKGLTLSSRGMGPDVALQELMDDEAEDGDDVMMEDDGEGEEEEWLEGDEEEDFEDDDMEDE
eukprot:TRINITY_DN49635_c0_g1_i1.p1 TRINITY_DN49635_c0_g1~~TRINITY_DN49635_c0_g1_i1.p1  ORF type:complete len:478 (-),score=157.04 TRINITY_DN49635_c0_g1_i1:75-1508(-)